MSGLLANVKPGDRLWRVMRDARQRGGEPEVMVVEKVGRAWVTCYKESMGAALYARNRFSIEDGSEHPEGYSSSSTVYLSMQAVLDMREKARLVMLIRQASGRYPGFDLVPLESLRAAAALLQIKDET